MKKIFMIIGLLMFSFGINAAEISGEKTASALITSGSGEVVGIEVVSDGTNAITMTLYDGTSTSGKKITPGYIISTSASNRTHFIGYRAGEKRFKDGLYVEISTVGTVAYVVSIEKD